MTIEDQIKSSKLPDQDIKDLLEIQESITKYNARINMLGKRSELSDLDVLKIKEAREAFKDVPIKELAVPELTDSFNFRDYKSKDSSEKFLYDLSLMRNGYIKLSKQTLRKLREYNNTGARVPLMLDISNTKFYLYTLSDFSNLLDMMSVSPNYAYKTHVNLICDRENFQTFMEIYVKKIKYGNNKSAHLCTSMLELRESIQTFEEMYSTGYMQYIVAYVLTRPGTHSIEHDKIWEFRSNLLRFLDSCVLCIDDLKDKTDISIANRLLADISELTLYATHKDTSIMNEYYLGLIDSIVKDLDYFKSNYM
jgi:hypothetical protein